MYHKKYYFLSGLPRSGNTVISSILNQNKDIGVSGNSLISQTLYNLEEWKKNDLGIINFPDHKSYDSMMESIISSYYSKWKQKYIIDRSAWGTPDNLNLLKRYCPNEIKIICLIRNNLDIFKSFVDWSNRNPNNFIDKNNKTVQEIFDFLYNPYGQIVQSILSVNHLNHIDPSNEIHLIINYNDFVNNPQSEINRIYNFLKIPPYIHKLVDLSEFKVNGIKYDDTIHGKNLHKIRIKNISRRKYEIEVSDQIKNQCSEFDKLINL